MLIPLKAFLGATCLTGSLAAGGVIGFSDDGGKADTEAEVLAGEETTTTTTEVAVEEPFVPEETTTTLPAPPPPAPPPPPVPAPPPVVLPAAEAGQVNVTINGDVIFVNGVNPLKGWTATVDREGDTIVVTFTRGDESVRVLADIFEGRLESKLQRLAAAQAWWEREHRDFRSIDWDGWDRWRDFDRDGDGFDRDGDDDDRWWDGDRDHRDGGRDRH